MKPNAKPVRVITGQVALFRCPVCYEEVTGAVEVEAHLGNLSMRMLEPDEPAPSRSVRVVADLPVVTKARSLRVNHQCGTVAEPQAAPS